MNGVHTKVALFGGSFNPIHIGHLALANYLCACDYVDEVWFLVSPHNPLKAHESLLDDDFRLELVRCATREYPRFKACDFEFRLPRPSFMSHTLAAIKAAYPQCSFSLLIGSDNWLNFTQWHNHEQLCRNHAICVYPRPNYPLPANTTLPPTVQWLGDAPTFEVSSTFIREAMAAGKDVRYFLHPRVYEKLCKRYGEM